MKSYNLETTFNFGMYKSKTLKEILNIDPGYVNWCIINLDHFLITDTVMDIIELFGPSFDLTVESAEIMKSKQIRQSKKEERYNRHKEEDDIDWKKESFNALTDGMLGDWEDFNGDYDDAMVYLRG